MSQSNLTLLEHVGFWMGHNLGIGNNATERLRAEEQRFCQFIFLANKKRTEQGQEEIEIDEALLLPVRGQLRKLYHVFQVCRWNNKPSAVKVLRNHVYIFAKELTAYYIKLRSHLAAECNGNVKAKDRAHLNELALRLETLSKKLPEVNALAVKMYEEQALEELRGVAGLDLKLQGKCKDELAKGLAMILVSRTSLEHQKKVDEELRGKVPSRSWRNLTLFLAGAPNSDCNDLLQDWRKMFTVLLEAASKNEL